MVQNNTLDNLLEKELQDPDFKLAFEQENIYLSIAVAIHQSRMKLHWTKSDLSKHSGVPISTISKIENGNNTSIDTLTKLASAMGKSLKIALK
ncbi:helix-turn-helix transcriptional regulator [Companilactobacillus zhachilii]|uniref:helix-turn-helix domain-containing protein n=1 Tax=Companilactobacillus zhachilii TaxID=2304606 RepID=UPI00192427B3|nr:helix-turn-helix transcriptional regulator [Companilactobacillus zhachilii]MBL3531493.1 helix-turn-helix transcriptional regulator [Companilactobacillus zhachilii]